MGYLIDSHCHLHDREFFDAGKAEKALKAARESGVEKIICIGTNHEDSLAARDFAEAHDGVYWTYGIHPEYADDVARMAEGVAAMPFSRTLSDCETSGRIFLTSPTGSPDRAVLSADQRMTFRGGVSPSRKGHADRTPAIKSLVAIGEVGLDYHYDSYDRTAQIRLFNEMLQLATDHDLPVCFHIREAFDDFFPVVANFPHLKGVVHCFTDSKKNLNKILTTTDFYIGVDGVATYSTIATPPLSRILLETDAPFLAPVPHRGEKNQPAYISDIAKWLSTKLDTPLDTVITETTKNVKKLYNI